MVMTSTAELASCFCTEGTSIRSATNYEITVVFWEGAVVPCDHVQIDFSAEKVIRGAVTRTGRLPRALVIETQREATWICVDCLLLALKSEHHG